MTVMVMEGSMTMEGGKVEGLQQLVDRLKVGEHIRKKGSASSSTPPAESKTN